MASPMRYQQPPQYKICEVCGKRQAFRKSKYRYQRTDDDPEWRGSALNVCPVCEKKLACQAVIRDIDFEADEFFEYFYESQEG